MLFECNVASVQVEADTVVITSGFTRLVLNRRQAREFHACVGEALDYLDKLDYQRNLEKFSREPQ